MRSSWQPDRLLGWLLPALAIVAEGAWLTVAYVAIETGLERRPPLLGVLELSIAAGVAALAVRRGWLLPDEQPLRFFGMLLLVGSVGWLWDDAAREALASGDPFGAVGMHPGGWLALVAFMRGIGRGGWIDDRTQTRVVLVGVPALAVPWLFGQLAADALRPVFVEEAFAASITFAAAGFMAAGLARLGEIGRETGIDWRRDRSWLALVVVALLVVLAAGIPTAAVVGVPLDVVARGILGPLLPLLGYLVVVIAYVLGYAAAALHAILSMVGRFLPGSATARELPQPAFEVTFEQVRGPLLGIALLWVALVILTIVLSVVWVRRRVDGGRLLPDEERSFHVAPPHVRLRLPRMRRPRRGARGTPRDAVDAYLAALRMLEPRRPLARSASETPRAHATRVAASTDPELGLLQADYALARYAGRRLTDAEDRRGVARWQRLRDRLRRLGHR